jgi:murein DD-endopeptidase MepM/ murein hydrolase activator NlpD
MMTSLEQTLALQKRPAGEARKAPEDRSSRIREAARKFESLMLQQVFKSMQTAGQVGEKSGMANDFYQGMFVEHVAESASSGGGMGLADALARAWGADELAAERGSVEQRALAEGLEGWNYPVEGRVSSEYGNRVHPITGEYKKHAGLDFAAAEGTPIRPTAPGRVVFAGERGGYGKTVEIEHPNGWTTRYAHASEVLVEAGQWVEADALIARVGSTGNSTGPHLHLEVRKGGRTFDPALLLTGARTNSDFSLKDSNERADVVSGDTKPHGHEEQP